MTKFRVFIGRSRIFTGWLPLTGTKDKRTETNGRVSLSLCLLDGVLHIAITRDGYWKLPFGQFLT